MQWQLRPGIALLALARRKVNAPCSGDCLPGLRAKKQRCLHCVKAALADARERPDYDVPVHLVMRRRN